METTLITGANRGIGLAFARHYAGAGWNVLAGCRSPGDAPQLAELSTRHPGRVTVFPIDVTDAASIAAAARAAGDRPIDLLLNNAGVTARQETLDGLDFDAWRHVLDVNTLGPVRVAAAFLDQVARSGRRLVVTVTSRMGSLTEDGTGYYAYRSSKAAVNMAMRCLAHDARGRGVAVVVVHPGWVRTDMGGEQAPLTPEQSVASLARAIDRFGMAESGGFFDHDGSTIPW